MSTQLVSPIQTAVLLSAFCWVGSAAAQPDAPSAAAPAGRPAVATVVADYFAHKPDHRPGDIITQSDVRAVLRTLAQVGWTSPDSKKILDDTLPDDHFVVNLLNTQQGRRFMGRVSGFDLIYDRLDRVSQAPGGRKTLEALVRLPDGERYARPKSQLQHGVPDFLELLPKNASGKVRSIRDYDKPTGRIYTADNLLARLSRDRQVSAPAQ